MWNIVNNIDDRIMDKSILNPIILMLLSLPFIYLLKIIIGIERSIISSPSPEKNNWNIINHKKFLSSATLTPNNASISEKIDEIAVIINKIFIVL